MELPFELVMSCSGQMDLQFLPSFAQRQAAAAEYGYTAKFSAPTEAKQSPKAAGSARNGAG
jgi:hypothetical protein